jgi:hypothetical protein
LTAQPFFCAVRRYSRGIVLQAWQAHAIAGIWQRSDCSAMPRLRRR